MERTHMTIMSDLELTKPKIPGPGQYAFKPEGFWYAFGNSWVEWCQGNMEHWLKPYTYTFDLVEPNNILLIDSKDALMSFMDQFGDVYHSAWSLPYVKWDEVQKACDGVEFNPYLYGETRFKLHLTWYNGIDVSSGVIFNTDLVQNLKRHCTYELFSITK